MPVSSRTANPSESTASDGGGGAPEPPSVAQDAAAALTARRKASMAEEKPDTGAEVANTPEGAIAGIGQIWARVPIGIGRIRSRPHALISLAEHAET